MKERYSEKCAISSKPYRIVLTVPKGADCGLYANMPASNIYSKALVPDSEILPNIVTELADCTCFVYNGLPEGVYHYGVSKEGFTSVCQIINFINEEAKTGIHVDVQLSPMAGTGYEKGYIMLNTQAFIDRCLSSHENAWGECYAHLFNTPWFNRIREGTVPHQQTTNNEMLVFIAALQKTAKNMYVFSLGASPKYGYDMPLVLFTKENVSGMNLQQAAQRVRYNGKPTVQYTAQVHGNEPASAEGAMAMMLDLSGDNGKILDDIDVYIIPRINIDGAVEVIRQSPTTGDDMNRDYLFMKNQEIRMVTGAYNLFLPELAIDGHEKRTNFLTVDQSRCTDMELQVGAGSLNHPAAMTEMAMEIALCAIEKGRGLGLRSHFYGNLASAAGGSAGSSYYGTRNSLSFLVETPGGTTLGGNCLARRVMAQYVLASTVMRYAAEHSESVLDLVHGSRKKMAERGAIYDESDIMVLEHGSAHTGSIPTPLIHVLTGEIADPGFDMAYAEQPVSLRSRIRPTAYIIPKGIDCEQEILNLAACHGIPYYHLSDGECVKLRQYVQKNDEVDLLEESPVAFEKGAYVFPNTVESTVLCVIMEPDFNRSSGRKMTLFSMGLVTADANGFLPVYRYCYDLNDGKVTVEHR